MGVIGGHLDTTQMYVKKDWTFIKIRGVSQNDSGYFNQLISEIEKTGVLTM